MQTGFSNAVDKPVLQMRRDIASRSRGDEVILCCRVTAVLARTKTLEAMPDVTVLPRKASLSLSKMTIDSCRLLTAAESRFSTAKKCEAYPR